MVRIMLAGESPQQRHNHHHSGKPLPFQPSPIRCQGSEADRLGLVGEDSDDSRQGAFGEISTNVDGSCWSNALAAESGAQMLPRDSSTCILWCVVSLGALARGHPLAQVGVFPRVPILPAPPLPYFKTTFYVYACIGLTQSPALCRLFLLGSLGRSTKVCSALVKALRALC